MAQKLAELEADDDEGTDRRKKRNGRVSFPRCCRRVSRTPEASTHFSSPPFPLLLGVMIGARFDVALRR